MDWTELPRGDPALLSPARHAEALTRLATRRLREGDPAEAALWLRRRLRLEDAPPAAAEYALLALALLLAKRRAEAEAALAVALDADPLDATAGLVALRLARSPEAQREAARRILRSPTAPDDNLAQAHAVLFRLGHGALARLDLLDDHLSGWIGWTGEPAPTLVLVGPDGEARHTLDPEPGLGFLPPGAAGAFVRLPVRAATARYRIERGGAVLDEGSLAPRRSRRPEGAVAAGSAAPRRVPERRPIRIVLPLFGDAATAAEAIRSAVNEAARHPGARLVLVDDASPDPAIRRLGEAVAARGLAELRRNPVNLGFTGAVRRGLDDLADEDVLLLNSDAALPPGSLARLAASAYRAPDIGTSTPFSNNGEWTSWPRLGYGAPAPLPEDAARLDEAARLDDDGAPVDLPNGVGFALFVRHDALQAAGGLSQVYERGYFEDLEWTAQMRRAGFRNVAAVDVFAPHHGSRSFGTEKPLLVARNLRRLRRRLPAFRAESAAFRRADPLREARARIEAACPPPDAPLLLVAPAGSALAYERLHRHRCEARAAVLLEWRRVGAVLRAELRRGDNGAPQSLGFDAGREGEALGRWLAALAPSLVELAGAPPPEPLGILIQRLDAAFVILAGDLVPGSPGVGGTPPLLAGFERWRALLGERWLQVVAMDGPTLQALGRHLASHPDARRIEPDRIETAVREPAKGTGVGLVMGVPSPASLRWTTRLAAALRQALPATPLHALGRSADDLALLGRGIGATGELKPAEFAPAARDLGLRALVLPPPDPSLALFDRILAETGLPGAAVDWSEGAAEPDPLSLLVRTPGESDPIPPILDWLPGRLAP